MALYSFTFWFFLWWLYGRLQEKSKVLVERGILFAGGNKKFWFLWWLYGRLLTRWRWRVAADRGNLASHKDRVEIARLCLERHVLVKGNKTLMVCLHSGMEGVLVSLNCKEEPGTGSGCRLPRLTMLWSFVVSL